MVIGVGDVVRPDGGGVNVNPVYSVESLSIWLSAVVNIGNVFAFTFMVFYLTLGRHLTSSLCVFGATTGLLVAIFTIIVMLRRRQLSATRLRSFMEPVRKGLIAHRGGASDAPENTLLALRKAKQNGASSVEFDLEMTQDGVAVLLHDSTVKRTTDGEGAINQLTFKEARKLNAAAKFGDGSDDVFEQIPTVEEAVKECQNLNMNIFFDVKNASSKMIDFLVDLFKKYPHLYDTGMVCSFFPPMIFRLRRRDGQILTALTTQPYQITDAYCQIHQEPSFVMRLVLCSLDFLLSFSFYNWLWYLVGNSAVLLKHTTVSQAVVDYWAVRNIAVITWTVNTQAGKDHFTKNLKIPVITDMVKQLL